MSDRKQILFVENCEKLNNELDYHYKGNVTYEWDRDAGVNDIKLVLNTAGKVRKVHEDILKITPKLPDPDGLPTEVEKGLKDEELKKVFNQYLIAALEDMNKVIMDIFKELKNGSWENYSENQQSAALETIQDAYLTLDALR